MNHPFDTNTALPMDHEAAEPESLAAQMTRLEQQWRQAEARYQAAEARHLRAARRSRAQGGLAFCALVGAILLSPTNRAAIAQGYGITLQQLTTRLAAVESKTQFMSADAARKTTIFSGCNVYINNGLGATSGNPGDPFNIIVPNDAVVNGLGNLIIGYNEPVGNQVTTGSHNLILGNGNNYSSFGGIVAGQFNTISAPFASVVGGQTNTAGSQFASVSGGAENTANGIYATISGGFNNTASGGGASVGGGQFNAAGGTLSSVSGGYHNQTSGTYSVVSGGGTLDNGGVVQSNPFGWAAGGSGNGTFHSP